MHQRKITAQLPIQPIKGKHMSDDSHTSPRNSRQNEWRSNLITLLMGFALFILVFTMLFGVYPRFLKWYIPLIIGFALVLHKNNDGVHRPLVSLAVLVAIVANSVYILRPDFPKDPSLWITNKLLYVFALPFFLSQAIENLVRSDRAQSVIMVIASFVWYGAFVVAYNAWSDTVVCIHVVDLVCTPDMAKRALYSAPNMWEDLGLGAFAIAFTAAYKMTQTREQFQINLR